MTPYTVQHDSELCVVNLSQKYSNLEELGIYTLYKNIVYLVIIDNILKNLINAKHPTL